LLSNHYTFQTIKLFIGLSLILGSIIVFLKVLPFQWKKIEFSYHEFHTLSMLTYGICVLIFVNSYETLSYLTAFMFCFYTFSEIIFCNWIFNLGITIVYKIVLVRVFLALMVGLGTVVLLYYFSTKKTLTIQGFGALFIIIGMNSILYVPALKRKDFNGSLK